MSGTEKPNENSDNQDAQQATDPQETKPSKHRAKTDINGDVYPQPDKVPRNYSVCRMCGTVYRTPKNMKGAPRFCSRGCRQRATEARKEAEKAFLAHEIDKLRAGEDVEGEGAIQTGQLRERAKRIRETARELAAEDPEARELARESRAKALLERIREAKPFSPEEAQRMQSGIAELVEDQIIQAHRVVMGTMAWSPVQARVFTALLDKCVPNLSASYTKTDNLSVNVSEMSREQLEAIVAKAAKTIEAEPISPDDAEAAEDAHHENP